MGADLAELTELAGAEFPRELPATETDRFFIFLAKVLPHSVVYQRTVQRSFNPYPSNIIPDSHKEILKTQDGVHIMTSSQDYTGCIRNKQNFRAEHFSLTRLADNGFKGLMFSMVPGWDIHEYSEEARQIWADTKEKIGEYFEAHPEPLVDENSDYF